MRFLHSRWFLREVSAGDDRRDEAICLNRYQSDRKELNLENNHFDEEIATPFLASRVGLANKITLRGAQEVIGAPKQAVSINILFYLWAINLIKYLQWKKPTAYTS
jgi:hypothetical protein